MLINQPITAADAAVWWLRPGAWVQRRLTSAHCWWHLKESSANICISTQRKARSTTTVRLGNTQFTWIISVSYCIPYIHLIGLDRAWSSQSQALLQHIWTHLSCSSDVFLLNLAAICPDLLIFHQGLKLIDLCSIRYDCCVIFGGSLWSQTSCGSAPLKSQLQTFYHPVLSDSAKAMWM